MFDRPLTSDEFSRQQRILQQRIMRKQARRRPTADDYARLQRLVLDQLRAELRAQMIAARRARRQDARQLSLMDAD
jgi:hypothetical protein